LINVGAYERGSDEMIDAAIDAMPILEDFLTQEMHQSVPLMQSMSELQNLFPPMTEMTVQ
jgi:flagellum-specific ATP synthase